MSRLCALMLSALVGCVAPDPEEAGGQYDSGAVLERETDGTWMLTATPPSFEARIFEGFGRVDAVQFTPMPGTRAYRYTGSCDVAGVGDACYRFSGGAEFDVTPGGYYMGAVELEVHFSRSEPIDLSSPIQEIAGQIRVGGSVNVSEFFIGVLTEDPSRFEPDAERLSDGSVRVRFMPGVSASLRTSETNCVRIARATHQASMDLGGVDCYGEPSATGYEAHYENCLLFNRRSALAGCVVERDAFNACGVVELEARRYCNNACNFPWLADWNTCICRNPPDDEIRQFCEETCGGLGC